MRVLLQRKFQGGWDIKESATTVDAQKIIMRMEKKQTRTTTDGVTSTFMSLPDIEYKTLKSSAWGMEFSADLVVSQAVQGGQLRRAAARHHGLVRG